MGASSIILIGFSMTGKSSVARKVAQRLGWGFLDTDERIIELAGKPIPRIFAEEGEDAFRSLEAEALRWACAQERMVIATGGGVVLRPENRELMKKSGVVICLEASPETVLQRLRRSPFPRPLLEGPNPEELVRSLKEARQTLYSVAEWTVHTDALGLEEVADEVLRGWHYLGQKDGPSSEASPICVVRTPTASYPIFMAWHALEELGSRMREAGLSGVVHIISDANVFPLYGGRVERLLEKAGFATDFYVVPAGEESKALEVAKGVYDWLVEVHAEREHTILALGGGVVGDLAGFVAATFLRGVPLVQVPTSLLAMVDASIGGKVGVNHPRAKNLIGAFYQPHLVLADLACLKTLPQRELTSGWAEVIKHALILDIGLFQMLEEHAEELLRLEEGITAQCIARSAIIKAQVVGEDERERGKRTLLNYGHTIGHALEAALSYKGLLHGEAVAIGMMGAALLSQRLGLISLQVVERQRSLLERFGLPTGLPSTDLKGLREAMALDKKVRQRTQRWVLLLELGRAVIREAVPQEEVEAVLRNLSP